MLAVRKRAVKSFFHKKGISQFCSFFPLHFSVVLMCLMGSAHPGQEGEWASSRCSQASSRHSRVAAAQQRCGTGSVKPLHWSRAAEQAESFHFHPLAFKSCRLRVAFWHVSPGRSTVCLGAEILVIMSRDWWWQDSVVCLCTDSNWEAKAA